MLQLRDEELAFLGYKSRYQLIKLQMKFKRQEVLSDTQDHLTLHSQKQTVPMTQKSHFQVAVSSRYQLSVQQLSKASQILDIINTGLRNRNKTKATTTLS